MTCITLPDFLPENTAEATIYYLARRSSYMAQAPYIQHKPIHRRISDSAMYLSPATWIGPSILKAHDVKEYKRDRAKMEAEYEEHQRNREKMGRPQAGVGMAMRPPVLPVGNGGRHSPPVPIGGMTAGRNSTTSASSEAEVPRARALFWEGGGSNLFSPGLLQQQQQQIRGQSEGWDEWYGSDSGYESLTLTGKDPWILPPIDMIH